MREMKNSGVDWIGDTPKSWRILKNKYIGEYINGYAFKPSDWSNSGKPIIRIQDLTGTSENPNYYNGDLCDKYVVKNGDVLISWAATLDAYVWSGCTAWLNQHIFKAIPNEDNINKYYFIWLMKVAMENMNNDNKHGIMMQHVTADVFDNYCLPVPPIEEQKVIADFLDEKCADIDEIISAKEKTNELLKERRQSIITEAVTKGLNPNAEMKDSGIDWIGRIPNDWKTIRLKHLGDAIIGLTYSPMDIVDDGTLVLRSSNIKDGKLVNADNVYVSKEIPENLKTKKGDILLCSRNGSKALIGKNSVITEDFVGSSFGAFMTIFRSDYNHYLKYVFNSSLFDYYLGTFLTTTINQLTTGNLDSIVIPLPTEEDEMKEIESYIESKCGEIDKLIESNNKTIEKLQEYRKSLIYEAVTGKIEIN